MSLPRNPYNERALNLDDLQRDTAVAVIKSGELLVRGTVLQRAEYTEDAGWSNIPLATADGEVTEINPYDTGVVCQPNGTWPGDPETCVLPAEA